MNCKHVVRSVLLIPLVFAGCDGTDSEENARRPLVGTWRAVLASPGGELPFSLEVAGGPRAAGDAAALSSVEGVWAATFTDADTDAVGEGSEVAQASKES